MEKELSIKPNRLETTPNEKSLDEESLDNVDFLNLQEDLQREGFTAIFKKELNPTWRYAPMELDLAVSGELKNEFKKKNNFYPQTYFPHISRTLNTVYNRRRTEIPDREPDRKTRFEKLEWASGYYFEDWITSKINNAELRAYYQEGVAALSSDEKSKGVYDLPTRKLDRPFYIAGGGNNDWLGGGNSRAHGIGPVAVDLWFSRMNPAFVNYLEHTLEKLESISVDDIIEAHLAVDKKYDIGIGKENMLKYGKAYFKIELPEIRNAIHELLTSFGPIKFKSDPWTAYQDGALIFLTTKILTMPLILAKNDNRVDPELNHRYESAMMYEYGDPEVTKYRWIDLSAMFSVKVGSASSTYLTIPEETWYEQSEQHVKLMFESKRLAEASKKIKAEKAAYIKEHFAELYPEKCLPQNIEMIEDDPAMAEPFKEIMIGPETQNPGVIVFLDTPSLGIFSEKRDEVMNRLAGLTNKGRPTLALGFAPVPFYDRQLLHFKNISEKPNFAFLKLPVTMNEIREKLKSMMKLYPAETSLDNQRV